MAKPSDAKGLLDRAKQMPKPEMGQSKLEFMAACMEDAGALDDFPDETERTAACALQYEHRSPGGASGGMMGSQQAAAVPNSKATPDGRRHSVVLLP